MAQNHTCNVVRELKWDAGQFKLVDQALRTNLNGESYGLSGTKLKQRSCEYSSVLASLKNEEQDTSPKYELIVRTSRTKINYVLYNVDIEYHI